MLPFCLYLNEKELLLASLMGEIRTASSSASVYPTTEVINARMTTVAAQVMKVSEEVAAQKLQQKLMLPVRKPAKGMALVISYQYIKRVVSHLNSSRNFHRHRRLRQAPQRAQRDGYLELPRGVFDAPHPQAFSR